MVDSQRGGSGGGRGYPRFQVTGMIVLGQRSKPKKIPLHTNLQVVLNTPKIPT